MFDPKKKSPSVDACKDGSTCRKKRSLRLPKGVQGQKAGRVKRAKPEGDPDIIIKKDKTMWESERFF